MKQSRILSAFLLTLALALGHAAITNNANASKKRANDIEVSGVVNINTAPEAQLRLLPGVGQKKAQAIIATRTQRPFTQASDITRVKGINQKMFQRIREHLAVSGDTTIVRRRIPRDNR